MCVLLQIRRADILMDVGDTLNAAIDIGQVEGAFVQGAGRWTMESMVWGDGVHPQYAAGSCVTNNPHDYLIPSSTDAPRCVQLFRPGV